MDLEVYLHERGKIIDDALDTFLPREKRFPPIIHEAMRYSVGAGGKRIRPILTLASVEAVGGDYKIAIPIACGIELIHTYSLIHDDLPCMDDAELRRGKPSNHKVYGEAMAVLAGDGLLTFAFEVISKWGKEYGADPYLLLNAVEEIARAAGPDGMVGGQAADILWEGRHITLEELNELHRYKTGALLVVSLRVGSIIAGGGEEELEALTSYGSAIGLAFQIIDDILDVSGDVTKLGKQVKHDGKNEKVTFPSLVGIERSKEIAYNLVEKGNKALEIFDEKAIPLKELGNYIIRRDN